jgi:hypothetical protein
MLSLQTPEGAQFVAEDRMGARSALLDPTDVQGGRSGVDLQAMPISPKDHGGVPVAVAVVLGSHDQPFDLSLIKGGPKTGECLWYESNRRRASLLRRFNNTSSWAK